MDLALDRWHTGWELWSLRGGSTRKNIWNLYGDVGIMVASQRLGVCGMAADLRFISETTSSLQASLYHFPLEGSLVVSSKDQSNKQLRRVFNAPRRGLQTNEAHRIVGELMPSRHLWILRFFGDEPIICLPFLTGPESSARTAPFAAAS